MDVFGPVVTTEHLPQTRAILKEKLPRIFSSKCFNRNHYSFFRESRSTEIGHLFEHVLLEFLTRERLIRRGNLKTYKGVTTWDWSVIKKGIFEIEVNCGVNDADIFGEAVGKSISLTSEIMSTNFVVYSATTTKQIAV